jgi:hypothetical protein
LRLMRRDGALVSVVGWLRNARVKVVWPGVHFLSGSWSVSGW